MKEYEINGTKYGLVLAYGILKELEGAVIRDISAATWDRLNKEVEGDLNDLEESAMRKYFDGKDLKTIILAEKNKGPITIAKVLRTVNGNSIGINFDERMTYVNEELDYDDGEAIFQLMEDRLAKIQEGQQTQGKSKLTSEEGGDKAEAPLQQN